SDQRPEVVSAPDEGGHRITTRNPGRVSQPSGNHRVKLAFLGSGAAFSLDRYNGAVVVDGRVLLDGGAPLLPHMHRLGVDPGDIEVVFVTHFHGDHTLGLPPFVLPRVFVHRRPLTFVAPSGVEQYPQKLREDSWRPDWSRAIPPPLKVRDVTAKASGAASAGRPARVIQIRASSSITCTRARSPARSKTCR